MGIVIKNTSGYYTILTDEFLKGIDQTNDPEQLRKYLRYFYDLLETNLSIKNKSEMPDGLMSRICNHYINTNNKEDICYE